MYPNYSLVCGVFSLLHVFLVNIKTNFLNSSKSRQNDHLFSFREEEVVVYLTKQGMPCNAYCLIILWEASYFGSVF